MDGRKPQLMSNIKRLILILFLLIFTTAIAFSQTPINLSGSGGLNILNSLAKSPLNQTNGTLNATNQTTNHAANLNGTNGTSSSDFWSWGGRPKNHEANYNQGSSGSSGSALAETNDLKDLNDLAEKNAFATA